MVVVYLTLMRILRELYREIFCSGCCKEGLLGLGSREPPGTGMEPPEGDAEAQVPLFFFFFKFFSIIPGDQRVLVYRIG